MTARKQFRIAASLVALALGLLFLALSITDSVETPDRRFVEQVDTTGKLSGESLPAVLPVGRSAKAVSVQSGPAGDGEGGRVAIGVSDAGVLLVALEATEQEVLDGLVDKALVDVVDLRQDRELPAVDAQLEKQSFRISGPIEEVLRVVMDKYGISYAISHLPAAVSQTQSAATRLFLYGLGEDSVDYPGEQQLHPGNGEAISAAGQTEPEGRRDAAQDSTRKAATVSDLLRSRALSSVSRPSISAAGNASQPHRPSPSSSSISSTPVSGSSDAEIESPSLADMTRKASEDVQSLVAGLKAVEKSLEAQRDQE